MPILAKGGEKYSEKKKTQCTRTHSLVQCLGSECMFVIHRKYQSLLHKIFIVLMDLVHQTLKQGFSVTSATAINFVNQILCATTTFMILDIFSLISGKAWSEKNNHEFKILGYDSLAPYLKKGWITSILSLLLWTSLRRNTQHLAKI